ncbi:acetyltransferase [Macrococcus brunensis]|uniref:acetyltransferase n=1 Tax=Macrococcus brunensis TaxID=198483 RepID=UPI001EF0A27D|nr:acetyltransferase [Macrococcus brunensis]ULG72703.1 acetyltransferase [Macrococcus brunensis]
MIKVLLIGDGGHSKVIKSMISRTTTHELYGVLDSKFSMRTEQYQIFYDCLDAIDNYKDEYRFIVAIGNNEIRKNIIKKYSLDDSNFTTIIDPNAIVADDVVIGLGTVVMPGAIINSSTIVGRHCIVNSGAIIEHDNQISDFVHISPQATLTGTVTVGQFSHIGAGATVIPNIQIGENVIVGAGSVVINNINDDCKVVGVPAKNIRR